MILMAHVSPVSQSVPSLTLEKLPVPSVVYGLWGLFFFQDMAVELARWLNTWFGWLPFFAVALFASLHAQRPTSATTAFPLTVDSIMRGPDLVGNAPSAVRWSGDSRWIYFSWQKPGEDEASTYVVSREGGEPRKLSKEEEKQAPATRSRAARTR